MSQNFGIPRGDFQRAKTKTWLNQDPRVPKQKMFGTKVNGANKRVKLII